MAATTQPPSSDGADERARETVLHPVDRIMELLFGLLMALSFTGAMSVAQSGREHVRELFIAALGCNLAWGLVDAVMYLVRTVVARGRSLTLMRAVRAAADAQAGRAVIESELSQTAAGLVSTSEVEAIRGRIVALPEPAARAKLNGSDLLAALAIFIVVVVSTFPVVVPFALMHDVAAAKNASRVIALVMLFLAGFALGRYAGYGSWRAGIAMAVLGALLVGAIKALGG
jgi:VIT1/CCC1 family predicted Fe2+/Mn2+ transporter